MTSAAQSQFPRPEMQEIGKPPSSTCPACREPSRPDRCPDDCWCHCHRETAACKCGDLIAEEVKSLTMNVDAKYLTSSDFVNAEKDGRARCPVHGSKT